MENNQVVYLDWPNGGSAGSDEFAPAPIRNNKAVFRAYAGIDFVVTILKKGRDCFGDVPKAKQCIANTKAGNRCKNMTDNPSQRCHIHK